MILLIVATALLPALVLGWWIYRKDSLRPEPLPMLYRAFLFGVGSAFLSLLISTILGLMGLMVYDVGSFTGAVSTALFAAALPEEVAKLTMLWLFLRSNKYYDEYFDGIVYASFIGLGFACIENIEYVFSFGFSTGVVRALISVPGHFLFGVVLGYFLSLAKFHSEKRGLYILTGLLLAMLAHGLFDWMLMITQYLNPAIGTVIYLAFIWGDIKLWKLGLKYINKQQENSRKQAQQAKAADLEYQIRQAIHGYDSEYKHIDWGAGDRR